MTGYIPSFELLVGIMFFAGFAGVLASLALHDPRSFLLMLRDSEAFAHAPVRAEYTVVKAAGMTNLVLAAE